MIGRRNFLRGLGAGAMCLGWSAHAEDAPPEPMVDEADAAAVAVEYVADATRVDAASHPAFRPDQNCASCAVYTGASGEASGGCVLFPHKRVTAQGWCTAWSGDS